MTEKNTWQGSPVACLTCKWRGNNDRWGMVPCKKPASPFFQIEIPGWGDDDKCDFQEFSKRPLREYIDTKSKIR